MLPTTDDQSLYLITVTWTPGIRLGDTGSIQVKLDPQIQKMNGQAGSNTSSELDCSTETTNIYCSFHPLVEARMGIPGIPVDPPDVVRKPFLREKPLEFSWTITANRAGNYPGTIWLYLDLVPQTSSGAGIRQPLLARHIEINVSNLLNIKTSYWRWLGGAGMLGSLLLLLWPPRNRIHGSESFDKDIGM